MSIKERFLQLTELGRTLLAAIENESWDNASQHAQHWDECIRDLFDHAYSDQFVMYKTEIENLIQENQIVIERLTQLRAKSLTQLQEANDNCTAIEYYKHIF